MASCGFFAVPFCLVLLLPLGSLSQSVRGVSQSGQPQYTGETFTCTDGSAAFPATKINDNYCDCEADGSDEPGTSACNTGRFYCTNKNFIGKHIFSSRVNDHVCDCCDGSDEFNNPSRCPNTCLEVGAAHRKAQAETIRVREVGARIKVDYIKRGQEAQAAASRELEELKLGLQAARADVELKRAAKEQAESLEKIEQEASKVARQAQFRQQLRLVELTQQQLADLVVTLGQELPEAQTHLIRLIGESLGVSTESNDAEGGSLGPTGDDSAQPDQELQDLLGEGTSTTNEEFAPVTPIWNSSLLSGQGTNDQAESARRDLAESETKLSELNDKITKLSQESPDDYGPDLEWWALKGRCFSTTASKYKYEICPYDRAKQDHTFLGSWKGWKDGKFNTMLFDDGDRCYNGPRRSASVSVKCGEHEAVISATETATCMYEMVLTSPAACDVKHAQELNLALGAEVNSDGSSEPSSS